MPILGGYEATRIIRNREKETDQHIPIIAMTALAYKEGQDHCIEAGMDDVITKPIEYEALIRKVDIWTRKLQ